MRSLSPRRVHKSQEFWSQEVQEEEVITHPLPVGEQRCAIYLFIQPRNVWLWADAIAALSFCPVRTGGSPTSLHNTPLLLPRRSKMTARISQGPAR